MLERHPKGSVFHSSGWAKILSETYGYLPRYLLDRERGEIASLLPVMEVRSSLTGRRGVALPFSDYCDPIYSEGETLRESWSRLIAIGRSCGWKTIELRCREELPGAFRTSASFLHHLLDLQDGEEALFRNLRPSTRRNIRKAEREGVTVSISGSADAVGEFYRLNCMTRREHGLPPQPMKFFANLHRHILKTGGGFIVLAAYRGRVVGADLFLRFGSRAYYKYGASDRNVQHVRAANRVMWEAILHCSRAGLVSLCFGRTEPENEGLRQFKNGWGGTESELHYYRFSLAEERFLDAGPAVFGWHNRMFRAFPIVVSRAIGAMLYRHIA